MVVVGVVLALLPVLPLLPKDSHCFKIENYLDSSKHRLDRKHNQLR